MPDLVEATQGVVIGDRNFWYPALKAELKKSQIDLEASFRKSMYNPWPERSAYLSRIRYRIDTVFSQ